MTTNDTPVESTESPAPDTNLAVKKDYVRSSGLQWAKANPQQAAMAIALFAQGESLRSVASSVGCSVNTVKAHLDRLNLWDTPKMAIGKAARRATLGLVNRLAEAPEDVPIAQVAISAKLMSDVAAAADGTPQQVIEHRHRIELKPASREDLEAFKARLKARTIDVESSIDAVGSDECQATVAHLI